MSAGNSRHTATMRPLRRALVLWRLFAILALAVNAKSEEQNFVKYHPSPNVRVIHKIVYAKYKTGKLRLDLYLPLRSGQRRAGVVVVRGGGWLVGDRKRFAHVASALADRGVVAACIEYRTTNIAAFPGAIQDVKAAVRWMRVNAMQYGIDPDLIGVIGGSSGAYMALFVGLTQGLAEFEGDGGNPGVSSAVQAVVAMAVPADLLALSETNKTAVAKFLHAMPEEDSAKWQLASPINHIRSDGPPVLLLHGENDDSVPTNQSIDFAQCYRRVGNTAELQILAGAPHDFWNYYPWFDDAMNRSAAFFHQLEKRESSSSVGLTPENAVPSTDGHAETFGSWERVNAIPPSRPLHMRQM
jgi:arylsulfatase A